jgi:hypothetical protein
MQLNASYLHPLIFVPYVCARSRSRGAGAVVEPVQAKETANTELIEGKPQCILPNDPYLLF